MTPEDLLVMGEHLATLVALGAEEQAGHLATLAESEPRLARRLRRRLDLDDETLPFARPLLNLHTQGLRPHLSPGDILGAYQISRMLGEGGMGEVYLAERTREFEQRVAIKRIRTDVDSPDFARRFENERRILARLEHPNIAHILDGGSTPEGDPYFVMEYVDGEPIDHYCERTEASTRERIELVLQLCEAVLLSHRRLVIHRDLKPNNVLVTQDGVVKLLDFGIAKLVHHDLGGDGRTQHLPMGAPSWASPEYLEGKAVDTRSDVYSLGVLLYCLLAERRPHDFQGLDYPTILAHLRDQPPETPSKALAQKLDEVPPRRRISRDLDAIVLEALRYEPEARYPSVEALANDLRAELDGQPVRARGDAWRYRWITLARRYRWPLVAAVSLLIISLSFAVTATTLWRQALAAQARAEQARDQAQVAQTDAERATAREQRENERTSTLLDTLLDQLEKRQWFGHPKPAVVTSELGQILYLQGNYQHAEQLLHEAQEYRGTLPEADQLILDSNLATVLAHRGEYGRAEALYDRVLAHRSALLGPEHPEVAYTLQGYGVLEYTRGELEEAEERFEDARAILASASDVHPLRYSSLDLSYAMVRIAQGRFDHAAALLNSARAHLGEIDHPRLRASIDQAWARVLLARGEAREAEHLVKKGLEVLRGDVIVLDWQIALAETLHGECLVAQGRYEEAERLLVEGERIVREARGETSIYARDAHRRLEDFARATGRPVGAP